MESHEALDRCIGKHRVPVAKAMCKSTTLISKLMEPSADFSDSGTLNPLDRLETIIKTALHEKQSRDDATAPILYLAQKFGMTVIPLPETNPHLQDIVKQSFKAIHQFGEYISAFSEAVEDGKITPLEFRHIETEGHRAIQNILTVIRMASERA